MDLRQLECFIKIFEAGSLLRAASQLHIAQSALSRRLAMLEEELGCKLFLRAPQGLLPTSEAQVFYKHAYAVFHQIAIAKEDIANVDRRLAGRVSIGVPVAISPILTYPLFELVRKKHPGITLQIREGLSVHLREMLQHSRLDMAVLFLSSGERALRVRPLGTEELSYVTIDPNVPNPIDIEDIAKRPLVIQSLGNGTRQVVEDEFRSRGLTVQPVAEIDSIVAVEKIIQSGEASAILPASVLGSRPALADLRISRISSGLQRPIALCTSEVTPPSLASEAVIAILPEAVNELVRSGAWKGFIEAG
jgi:LysR family transcriptional regulator, nitrogen assimilation regulatory protein